MSVNEFELLNGINHLFETENLVVNVVCASDNNYSMQLAVMLRSVLENLDGDYKINAFVIDGGITNENKNKIIASLIIERCNVNFVKINDTLNQIVEQAHELIQHFDNKIKADYVSIASFYRLLIPKLLPEEINKVIYLDCDMVVTGNLSRLWEIDIEDNYLLAAQDTWIPYISSSTGNLNYMELGIAPESKYFNAGVLVINLEKWRNENVCDQAIEYFKENMHHIGWYDQGLLNSLLVDKWGQLEPGWNFNPTSFYNYHFKDYLPWRKTEQIFAEKTYNDAVMNPHIIHFVSENKPWTSRHTPRKEYFFNYVDMTAWSGWRLTIWKRIRLRMSCFLKDFIN